MSVLKEKAKSILAVASITIKMEINVAIKVDFLKSFLFSSSGGTKNKIEKPLNIKIFEIPVKKVLETPWPKIGKIRWIVILGTTAAKAVNKLITIITHKITLVLAILFIPCILAITLTTEKKSSK